jgi:hypothetical protein
LAQGTSNKEQMTQFLPARIFSVFVLVYGCYAICLGLRANPFGFQTGIPGVKEDQTGYEKGCAWHEVALRLKRETYAASPRAAQGGAARGPTLKRTDQPFSFIFVFFSPFSLFGAHFAPTTSFAHISRSGTPIDNPSSSTRHTSKDLLILTILFSFERLECAALVILFFMSFCSFLAIQDSD